MRPPWEVVTFPILAVSNLFPGYFALKVLRQEKGLVLKCLREHLNPEPSMKEERMGVEVEKSWKMDSLTSKDNK